MTKVVKLDRLEKISIALRDAFIENIRIEVSLKDRESVEDHFWVYHDQLMTRLARLSWEVKDEEPI
jgi:hypothetical protein